MKVTFTKVIVTSIATAIAVVSIALVHKDPINSTLYFSAEVILLPAIYIIGNMIAEKLRELQFQSTLADVGEHAEKLNENYYKERLLNVELRNKIWLYENGQKTKKNTRKTAKKNNRKAK